MTESGSQYSSVPTSDENPVPIEPIGATISGTVPALEIAEEEAVSPLARDSPNNSNSNDDDNYKKSGGIELSVFHSKQQTENHSLADSQKNEMAASRSDQHQPMGEAPSDPTKKDDASAIAIPVKDNLSIHGTAPLYEVLTPREQKLILYSVYCARFLAVLDATIVAVTIPSILRDLGGQQYLSWLVAAYLLSDSVVLPLSGRLSDIYGRRIVYMVSLVIFLVASALCGAATDIWFLIGARFFQGIGGGGLTGMTMIIPGDVVPPKDRPGIFGVLGIIAGLGALLGPIIGGGLTDAYSWRLVFYINLPPGIFSFFLAITSMKRFEVPGKKLELDYLGSILISIATICLILFITWGGEDSIGYPWTSPQIVSLIWAFAFSSVLFIIQEYRHPLPTLQLRLHKIKNVGINYIMIFFAYYSMISVVNYLAVYFQEVMGDKAVISGLKLAGFVIGFIIMSRFSGKILQKTSKSNYVMGVCGCILAIGLGLTSLVSPTLNYGFVFLFTTIMGVGIGYLIPASGAIIQVSVPQKDIAVAMANFSFDSYIGGCIGVTVSGTIFTRVMNSYLAKGYSVIEAKSHGVSSVFLYAVPPIAIAACLGFFLDPVKKKKTKAEKEALKAQAEALKNGASSQQNLIEGTKTQISQGSTTALDSQPTAGRISH